MLHHDPRLLAVSGTGHVETQVSLESSELGHSGSEQTIAVLGSDTSEVRAIQNAILFSERRSDDELFEQPGVNLIFMSPSERVCSGSYDGLSFIVIGPSIQSLPSAQVEALRQALLFGAQVVIAPGEASAPLSDYLPGPGPGAVHVGRGRLVSVEDPFEQRSYAFVREQLGRSRGRPTEVLVWPHDGLVGIEAWRGAHFLEPRLPDPGTLFLVGVLYIVVLGPLSFFLLRSRDRREWGWLTTPAIALVFAASLAIWIVFHQSHERRIDSCTILSSSAAHRDVLTRSSVRLSSPDARSYTLTFRGDWSLAGAPSPDIPEPPGRILFRAGALEIGDAFLPAWASADLAVMGRRSAAPPVERTPGGLRNVQGRAFDGVLWLTERGFTEAERLAPGEEWVLPPETHWRVLSLLSSPLRHQPSARVQEEPFRLHQVIELPEYGPAGVERARERLADLEGVFIGCRREAGVELSVDAELDAREEWSVYVHAIPRRKRAP
jgi:hypothetical protein